MSSNIKDLTKEALELYLQIKSDTEKLKQLKNEILEKTSEDTKIIPIKDSSFRIFQSKDKFRYILNKDFNKLPENKQIELYNTGLLKIVYKINKEKYHQSDAQNIKNDLDRYVDKKEISKRRIAIYLGDNTIEDFILEGGSSQTKEQVNELEYQIEQLEAEIEELKDYNEYLTPDDWYD